ncbi:TPA: hypothetical protein ACPZG2_004136 [Yersinia enterocolitica]
MSDIKIKWLFYTLIIACLPFAVRYLIKFSTNISTDILTISDLVAFSLVMQVSTIGGAENLGANRQAFKTVANGLSYTFAIFSGLYYAISLILQEYPALMKMNSCLYALSFICVASTFLSYATHDRIYKDSIVSGEKPCTV